MQTDLYRHYDKNDKLLYVGISISAVMRARQHKGSAGWFDSIIRMTVEKFATREEALKAEELAIREEGPLYNRIHTRPKRLPKRGHWDYLDGVGAVWVMSEKESERYCAEQEQEEFWK